MDVSHLQVDQGIHVRDLTLPPDVTVDADPDLLLAHVVIPGPPSPSRPRRPPRPLTQPEVIKPERKEKEKEDDRDRSRALARSARRGSTRVLLTGESEVGLPV